MTARLSDRLWRFRIWASGVLKHLVMFSPLEPAYLSTARRLAWRPSPSSASPLVGEGRGVGSSVEVTIPYRLRMLVPSTSPSLPYFRTGLYEQDLTDQLAKQIKPGQNIVDLGANTGYYTLVASKLVGSSGRVYAFEPDPAMFGYLTRNIALNACENVTAVQQAVSDRVGSASFIRQEQERGFLSSGDHSGSLEVPTTTLDDYFGGQGWPAVHLVKMDVEGSELAALLGMIELSRRNPQLRLVMEFNLEAMRRAGVSSLMLTAALGGLGFRDASVIEKRLRPVPMQPSLRESGIVHDLLLVK